MYASALAGGDDSARGNVAKPPLSYRVRRLKARTPTPIKPGRWRSRRGGPRERGVDSSSSDSEGSEVGLSSKIGLMWVTCRDLVKDWAYMDYRKGS